MLFQNLSILSLRIKDNNDDILLSFFSIAVGLTATLGKTLGLVSVLAGAVILVFVVTVLPSNFRGEWQVATVFERLNLAAIALVFTLGGILLLSELIDVSLGFVESEIDYSGFSIK